MDVRKQVRVDRVEVASSPAHDSEQATRTNVWVVGDDKSCVVVDAAGPIEHIQAVVADRRVVAIMLTQPARRHSQAAPALRAAVDAPILMHYEGRSEWEDTHHGVN